MSPGGLIQLEGGKRYIKPGRVVVADECCCDGDEEPPPDPVYKLTPCVETDGAGRPRYITASLHDVMPWPGCYRSAIWDSAAEVNRTFVLGTAPDWGTYAAILPAPGTYRVHDPAEDCPTGHVHDVWSVARVVLTVAVHGTPPEMWIGVAWAYLWKDGSAYCDPYWNAQMQDGAPDIPWDGMSPITMDNAVKPHPWEVGNVWHACHTGGYLLLIPGDIFGDSTCPGGASFYSDSPALAEFVDRVVQLEADRVWYQVSVEDGPNPVAVTVINDADTCADVC